MTAPGMFPSLAKCQIKPSHMIEFLGFVHDSCTMMSYLTEDQLGRMFKLAEDTLSYDTLEQKQVTDDNLTASDARRLRASVGVERLTSRCKLTTGDNTVSSRCKAREAVWLTLRWVLLPLCKHMHFSRSVLRHCSVAAGARASAPIDAVEAREHRYIL